MFQNPRQMKVTHCIARVHGAKQKQQHQQQGSYILSFLPDLLFADRGAADHVGGVSESVLSTPWCNF